ncbi:MAG: SMI1/KNR4 family protein, partial [Lachnospiraceae bacterium]|nr:SMI1/KNR4 family protein [Lachnospiraceae bacterium]
MTEFQEGTLDTLMERLCSSISSFDPEWVTRCVPATEEQIQQLQDILAEYHYTIPAAYLYYLKRMGQDDGGLLETECSDLEVDIGTVLELLPDRGDSDSGKDLEEGLFQFSDHWADSYFCMKLSNTEDNPMVTDLKGVYIAESFEKFLFRKAFYMYKGGFTYRKFESDSVCTHHEKNKKEDCRTCPHCRDTEEERMDFIHQMAETYGLKKAWFSDQSHFICYNASYAFEIDVCRGYSIKFSCNDDKLWEQVRYSLGLFSKFFACLSSFEKGGDGKDDDDVYKRHASFNRYGDPSKLITDPDLLQVTEDECVYISNENDYDIAVDLEGCYAPFNEVKPFIAFLATQICELDNVAQRFHQKKRIKNNGRGGVRLPSPAGMYRID